MTPILYKRKTYKMNTNLALPCSNFVGSLGEINVRMRESIGTCILLLGSCRDTPMSIMDILSGYQTTVT